MVLPDPVIHLYWAYALAKAEEMFKVTRFPPGVCGAQAEREYVTLDPGLRERGNYQWPQLRDTPLDLTYLPPAAPKILVIEHADFLAIRSLTLDPVVGPVVRYVNHLVG